MKSQKYFYRIVADALFLVHLLLFILVLTGYLFPKLWYPYMIAISITLISDIIFDCCLVSKWEFDLRKKANPAIEYNYTFATFYTYKLTNSRMSDIFYRRMAVIFLALSLGLNVYFHYFFV